MVTTYEISGKKAVVVFCLLYIHFCILYGVKVFFNSNRLTSSKLQFSYNAAKEPETFIGDYAFHEARQEQVTGSILEERMFHILKLFQKMRHKLPTLIVITRDGVSEGQHKMVSFLIIFGISGTDNLQRTR